MSVDMLRPEEWAELVVLARPVMERARAMRAGKGGFGDGDEAVAALHEEVQALSLTLQAIFANGSLNEPVGLAVLGTLLGSVMSQTHTLDHREAWRIVSDQADQTYRDVVQAMTPRGSA